MSANRAQGSFMDRKQAKRAAVRHVHRDKYADKPKGADRELLLALAALSDYYSKDYSHASRT